MLINKADELHSKLVKLDGSGLVWCGQTLDHHAAQTDVRDQARVANGMFLGSYLRRAMLSLEGLSRLIWLIKSLEAVYVQAIICCRLAERHNERSTSRVIFVQKAALCKASCWLCETYGW